MSWWPPHPSSVPSWVWRLISADADGDGIHDNPKDIASMHQIGFCGLLILCGVVELYLTLSGQPQKIPTVGLSMALIFLGTGIVLWYFDIVKYAIFYTIWILIAVITLPFIWMDDPPLLDVEE